MYHNSLTHSSAEGHLGCFHVLAFVNSAAMSTGVHTSLSLLVFSVHISSSGITRSYGRSIFSFLRNEVDETRAYYTEWNKSERKTPIIYMEFRKMVMMTLYVRQQKRHRCKEQTSGLCGRRRGWDDLREYHWNICITMCEINHQSKSMHDTGHSKPVHWDTPEG